jgi:methylated-DNA-[protein]-cysteine S-methyltransferase
MADELVSSIHDSPIGGLTLVAGEAGLRAVLWPADDEARVPSVAGARSGRHAVLDTTMAQLDEYFAGRRREFDLPLDPVGTEFQRSAWNVLRTIPYGATMSYGEQAAALGDAKKARAVGSANGRNPLSIVVPCHRVIGTSGKLTGFAGGIEAKRYLLEMERRNAT